MESQDAGCEDEPHQDIDFASSMELPNEASFLKPTPRERSKSGAEVAKDKAMNGGASSQHHRGVAGEKPMRSHLTVKGRSILSQNVKTSLEDEFIDTSGSGGDLSVIEESLSESVSGTTRRGNPLSKVKMAEEFLLSEDTHQPLDKNGTTLLDKNPSAKKKSRKSKQVSPPKTPDESKSDSLTSINLKRNVFSIDQLQALETSEGTDSRSQTLSDTSDSMSDDGDSPLGLNFATLHTVDELELAEDASLGNETTISKSKKSTYDNSNSKEPEILSTPRFKFRAEANAEDGRKGVRMQSDGGEAAFLKRPEKDSYSDEEFEPETLTTGGEEVEEEIAEELSGGECSESSVSQEEEGSTDSEVSKRAADSQTFEESEINVEENSHAQGLSSTQSGGLDSDKSRTEEEYTDFTDGELETSAHGMHSRHCSSINQQQSV